MGRVAELGSFGGFDVRVRKIYIFKALVGLPALLAALAWAGSFAQRDIVWILCPNGGAVVSSSAGKLQVLVHNHAGRDGWSVQHQGLPAEEQNRIDPVFGLHVFSTALQTSFPHWCLVLLLGVPAILYLLLVPWPDRESEIAAEQSPPTNRRPRFPFMNLFQFHHYFCAQPASSAAVGEARRSAK